MKTNKLTEMTVLEFAVLMVLFTICLTISKITLNQEQVDAIVNKLIDKIPQIQVENLIDNQE